jgi:hypothetical protein
MNSLRTDILARRVNRIDTADNDLLSHDTDVLSRQWLLIDADPKRDPKISASKEEKAIALEGIKAVYAYLNEKGFPNPIFNDSGNGYHLFYKIAMPNDEATKELVKRLLSAVGQRFDIPNKLEIDKKVFNASRIVKVPMTMARKGDHTDDRPHRRGKVIDFPKDDTTGQLNIKEVPRGLVEQVALEYKEDPSLPPVVEAGRAPVFRPLLRPNRTRTRPRRRAILPITATDRRSMRRSTPGSPDR